LLSSEIQEKKKTGGGAHLQQIILKLIDRIRRLSMIIRKKYMASILEIRIFEHRRTCFCVAGSVV
jgi:hypothetical protein